MKNVGGHDCIYLLPSWWKWHGNRFLKQTQPVWHMAHAWIGSLHPLGPFRRPYLAGLLSTSPPPVLRMQKFAQPMCFMFLLMLSENDHVSRSWVRGCGALQKYNVQDPWLFSCFFLTPWGFCSFVACFSIHQDTRTHHPSSCLSLLWAISTSRMNWRAIHFQ